MPCTGFCQSSRARGGISRSRTKGSEGGVRVHALCGFLVIQPRWRWNFSLSGKGQWGGTSTCPVRFFAKPVALEVDFLVLGPRAVGGVQVHALYGFLPIQSRQKLIFSLSGQGQLDGTSTCRVRCFANPGPLEVDFLILGPGAVAEGTSTCPVVFFCQSEVVTLTLTPSTLDR